jgi:carboxylesterase type B
MVFLMRAAFVACAAISCLARDGQDLNPVGLKPPEGAPTATVRNGTYIGVHSKAYDQDFYLGIPLAQPPVENLRFRNPQPLTTKWSQPRSANAYSASCVGYGGDNIAYPSQSEDCLYLNIVRPSGFGKQKLPVGFWIHGGAYYMGSAIDPRYNLSRIVQQSVEVGKPFIGVSINYRVSAWGFISSEEVLKSGQTNLGARDQRQALRWVQENIEAFGGKYPCP